MIEWDGLTSNLGISFQSPTEQRETFGQIRLIDHRCHLENREHTLTHTCRSSLSNSNEKGHERRARVCFIRHKRKNTPNLLTIDCERICHLVERWLWSFLLPSVRSFRRPSVSVSCVSASSSLLGSSVVSDVEQCESLELSSSSVVYPCKPS